METLFIVLCAIGYAIITAYVIHSIVVQKGIPESISSCVYHYNDGEKWLFSLVMLIVAFCIMPQLLSVITEGSQPLAWLMSVGLVFVGGDPLDKNYKNVKHYIGAAICGASSQLILAFNMPILLALWTPYVIYTLAWEHSGKNMFFAELIMMIGIGILCFV